MNTFELIHKSGPHGDACYTYDVKFKQEHVTLYDFLKDLSEDEWGSVFVIVPNPKTYNLPYAAEHEKYMKIEIKYKAGIVITSRLDYALYGEMEIDQSYDNWANGGWSNMDYWIKLIIK